MKKALIIVNMLFVSASVFGMENSQILQQSSEQTQQFVTALRSGDIERVEQSIRDGADVNNTEIDGTTPLIFAVKNDNRPLVKTLILSGVNVDAEDSQHETALSAAIDLEHDLTVQVLVKTGGADIYKNGVFDKAMQSSDKIKGCMERLNIRPLVESVKNNDIDGVKKALKNKKVNINGRDNNGYTPLMYAALRGNLDIIDLLLDNGANVDAVSDSGDNALFFAARNGHTGALSTLMLKHIANKIDADLVKEAIAKPHGKKGELLEENIGETGKIKGIASALMQKNNLGQTLLISALRNNREDTAIWLINHGADVNKACDNESPLMIAAELGQKEAVAKLLDKGANINFRNKNGTALNYVMQSDAETPRESRNDVAMILISRGLNITDQSKAFDQAVKRGYSGITRMLAGQVDDINLNSEDIPNLKIALTKGYFDVADVLIQNKANVNFEHSFTEQGEKSDTTYAEILLNWAVREGSIDIVKWLINNGADINFEGMVKIKDAYHDPRYRKETVIYKKTPLAVAESKRKSAEQEKNSAKDAEKKKAADNKMKEYEEIVGLLRAAGAHN